MSVKRFAVGLIVWLIGFLFLKYILQFLTGIGYETLRSTYQLTAEQIGFLAGSYFYAYLIFQVPAGIIVDHFKVSKVAFCSLLICLLGMILFAIGDSFSELFIGRTLIGTGVAFATVSYMRAAALYFSPESFSRLSGFFGAACMSGAGAAILVLGWFFDHFGWINLLLLTISITALLVLVGLYFVKQEKHYQSSHTLQANTFSFPHLLSVLWGIIKRKDNILLIMFNGLAFAPIAVFGGLWGKSYFTHHFTLEAGQANMIISALFYIPIKNQFAAPIT